MANFGDFGVIDYTALMTLVPRQNNLLQRLGLFTGTDIKYGSTTVAEFERQAVTATKIAAKARGADRQYVKGRNARKEYFPVPFFPLDGTVNPSDIQDFRMIGTEDSNETVENRVRQKIADIQLSHEEHLYDAMYYALIENKTYSPELEDDERDFSTVWGAPRKQVAAADFDLTDQTVDPFDTIEAQGRKHIIANAGDNASGYEVMFIVDPDTFTKLVGHTLVRAAYASYASAQEPLRNRLGGDSINRIFRHKGVVVVEDISGKFTVSATEGKGYLLPTGINDMYRLQYAPADTMEHANQTAEENYLFMREDFRHTKMESETSFVCMISRPELIVEFTSTIGS